MMTNLGEAAWFKSGRVLLAALYRGLGGFALHKSLGRERQNPLRAFPLALSSLPVSGGATPDFRARLWAWPTFLESARFAWRLHW